MYPTKRVNKSTHSFCKASFYSTKTFSSVHSNDLAYKKGKDMYSEFVCWDLYHKTYYGRN